MISKKLVNISLIFIFFISLFFAMNSVIFETNLNVEQAIARVGEKEISRQRFEEIIKVLDDQSYAELSLEKKILIRERLIDEELLIQRALEMNLVRNDNLIKGNIIQTMFNYILKSSDSVEPTEEELKKYFNNDKDYFTSAKSYKLKVFSFKNYNDAKRAKEFLKSNNLDAFLNLSDKDIETELPAIFLTPQKIRDYLGPDSIKQFQGLTQGGHSEIFEINGIHTIILCLDVLSEFVPTFEEVSDQVKTKFIKDRDDALVKEYIENLRNFYDIEKYSL